LKEYGTEDKNDWEFLSILIKGQATEVRERLHGEGRLLLWKDGILGSFLQFEVDSSLKDLKGKIKTSLFEEA